MIHRNVLMASSVIALTLALSGAQAANSPPRAVAAWREAVAEYEARLESEDVVGASALLMRAGAVIGESEYGFQHATTKHPVSRDTIYHWASNTKTLTGIAIMQLRDRGTLQLDDPVTRYLPEFRAVHNPFGSPDAIRIRHLLTHSSGLRARTWPWRSEGWQPFEPTQWAQLVAMFPYTRIEFAPGSKYSYSNLGITLLGRIIEVVSGEDIEVYLDKHILKPLGMYRSYFDLTPWHLRRDRSHNYLVDDQGTLDEQPTELDTGVTVANGGLNAPLADMMKYADFLLGLRDNGNYQYVLSRTSLIEMLTPALPISRSATRRNSIGLVFFVSEQLDPDGRVVESYFGHSGSQSAFRSWIKFSLRHRAAFIAAINTTGPEGRNTAIELLRDAVDERIIPALGEDRARDPN